MADLISQFAGLIGFVALVFLPGAWITFGLYPQEGSFWIRLSLGAVLSPLIVCFQFYAVRIFGVSFELTVPLLAIFNIPAIFLIWRQRKGITFAGTRTLIHWGLVLLVPLACISGPMFLWPEWRLFWGHPWMYADAVYMIANGELVPQDALLAGVTLSYPWAAHVYQAVLSFLLDSPPMSGYVWMHVLWLAFVAHLTAAMVIEFGGNRLSALATVTFLFFGVNFAGYILSHTLPQEIVNISKLIWGDYRYTPWLLKFCSFNQMPFALGFFSGITFLMITRRHGTEMWAQLSIVFLLLLGVGLFYPLLLPAACGVVLAGALCVLVERPFDFRILRSRRFLSLGLVVFLSAAITFLYLSFVTQDSMKGTMLGFSSPRSLARKILESIIVTLPLLAGLGVVFMRYWNSKRYAISVLLVGALASLALHAFLDIPYFSNEYKFILTAAICLAPFAGLALEPLLDRMGPWALLLNLLLALALAMPFFHKLYPSNPLHPPPGYLPLVDTRHFNLQLNEKERYFKICKNISEKTPRDTILVVDKIGIHLPTLTRRKLFAPPDLKEEYPGISLSSETYLGSVRGYDPGLVQNRKLMLDKLFKPQDLTKEVNPLDGLLELGKPLALILDGNRNRNLLNWLEAKNLGVRLFAEDGLVLWFIDLGRKHQRV